MSEEQVAEQAEDPPETSEREGGRVEFPDPEVEARFNEVYGEMKQYERISKQSVRTVDQLAAENAKLIERLDKMESSQAEKATSDRLSELGGQEKEAMESGDFDRATEIRNQITDLKVDSKVQVEKPQEPEESWLTPEREQKISDWSAARDEKGNLLRPWADPDHEDHETAISAAQVIIAKNPNMDLEDLLEKIEKVNGRVTSKPARPFAGSLSGNSDVRPKAKKVALTEDEKLIAKRMYPGDPKAAEKYAVAKEKYL